MKILIIPDKFKGTLTASAAAEAIARGWRKARPRDPIALLPMSDGGDGFGEVMSGVPGAKGRKIKTVDAAHRKCEANWWWEPKTKTAIIESANVIGLAKLPPGQFHPFQLDTFGLGKLIQVAAQAGARQCIIGIGGSATNDGGFGLARALGWRFFDNGGNTIECWTELHRLDHISAPKRRQWFRKLIVAVDVRNPLLGARGATRVYGPQKGLRPPQFREAERNLQRLAAVVHKNRRRSQSAATTPGAGAAGGLGFGLMAFLGARPEPGFNLFARFANLDTRLRAAELVITGEGCIDNSTFMGKGVGEIARRCRKWKIPCIAVAGDIAARRLASRLFFKAHALSELTTIEAAKSEARFWLDQLAVEAARHWVSENPLRQ